MKSLSKILFIGITLLFANFINSQTVETTNVYQTDFEDEAERQKWHKNTGVFGPDCSNQWHFGKPGANVGEYGLFVSGDGGKTTNYNKVGSSVVVYRKFHFAAGDYELSFDWQAGGMADVDGLFVCWVPAKDSVGLNSVNTSMVQKWINTYGLDFGSDSLRLNQRSWNTICDTIHSDGDDYYLAFVWNNGSVGIYPPAACIDNILIMELGRCNKPTNLTAASKGDDVVLSWSGTADAYDVRCCNNASGEMTEYHNVTTPYQVVSDLPEGICTYYVRSVCDGARGAWVSIEKFLFYPGRRCIDYLDINSNNCFYGTTDNPRAVKGTIDFGSQSIESRHTIHWNPMERDPQTGGQLKTVPDGELASVRLGNWDTGAEAECIEYNYFVDTTTSAILLLNYAVVLEDPGHDSLSQPRFTLEVLYNNKSLDEFGCGEAFFSAGFNTEDWNAFDGGYWKDWTTVAINLGKYHGKSLKVKLTTYDCTQTGHFGYAYFTLGCSDGKIKGLSCGDAPNNVFEGPEGFKYRWYLLENPENIISTERVLSLPSNDTLTYYLDVIQPTNENCHYTLSASAVGRWPRAAATYSSHVTNCKNVVDFKNLSYIKRINQITGDSISTNEECESFLWKFSDGTESREKNPQHIFPDEGGEYTITLYAGIADDMCKDDTTFTISLPKVGTMRDTIYAIVCNGKPYKFKDKYYYVGGCYADTAVSFLWNCDSITVLNLHVAMPYDTTLVDTICSHEEYYFNGKRITKTGIYENRMTSVFGCDSVVKLDIVVNETLDLTLDSVVRQCADDEFIIVPFVLHSGVLEGFQFYFDEFDSECEEVGVENNAFVIKMPQGLSPNRYKTTIHFGEQSCGKEQEGLLLDIQYSSDIIVQRWGDVLAVVNADYNGGYEFIGFQWFKNGVAIEGATSSILYIEEGLDLSAEYSVLLTRLHDNVAMMTCVADLVADSSVTQQSIVLSLADGTIEVESVQAAQLKFWSSTGVLVRDEFVVEGSNKISTQGMHGVYILEFIYQDNQREIKQVIIE